MTRKPIPVVVVAGFLGSGKTTLLNHLLRTASGARIGVVVNDFGSIGIDAMAVAGQVDAMVALENGCLCCAVDASGLDAMLEKLASPAAGLDAIVIEASGLAEPRGLIRLVLASENPDIEYGGLVEVVDGAEFEATRQAHPELASHVRMADLVVLNKLDRLSGPEVLATVRELAEGPVLPVEHGRVDPALLFDLPERVDAGARQLSFLDLAEAEAEEDHSAHAHARYDTVSFSSTKVIHPRRLIEFLERRPAGLYRMKGYVHFGLPEHGERFSLHTVGAFVRLTRSSWPVGTPRRTDLVLIGSDIDTDELLGELRAVEVDNPGQVDAQAMLGVLRFLPDRDEFDRFSIEAAEDEGFPSEDGMPRGVPGDLAESEGN